MANLIPEAMEGKVLDAGCAGGFYSLLAAERGTRNIVALDSSTVCVQGAKINLLNMGLSIDAIIGDATRLPLQNECFDLVLCIDLIEHIWQDDLLLHEISRVLRPQGKLLIATQNSSSINYLVGSFVHRWVLKNRRWMGWDPTHARFYNFERLSKLLESSSLELVKVASTYFVPYMQANRLRPLSAKLSQALYLILKRINDIPEKWGHRKPLKRHGWGIICLALKRS